MTSLTTRVIFRLVGVYLWAFACVLWPHFREPWHRAACLYCVAMWARRPGRDFPVMVSAACMWLGEVVAVRFPSTWKYDGFGHDVPPWLLPLWILSAMFTVDAADATRPRRPRSSTSCNTDRAVQSPTPQHARAALKPSSNVDRQP